MKKILFTAIFLFSTVVTFSQTKFGLKGGLNFANMALEGEETNEFEVSPSSRTSFHVGGFAEIGLGSTFVFQPALLISGKGYKIDYSAKEGGYSINADAKVNLLYVELPLNFVAKLSAGQGKFLIGGGPYVGYALEGKSKGEIEVDGPGTEEDSSLPLDSDTEFGDAPGEIKRLDYGLNLLTGYELKSGLIFNIGYGLGLSNLSNEAGNASAKHKVLSLSVGFKF